jgi:hypothetical protein
LARYIALDWDQKQLLLMAAVSSGGKVQIHHAAVLIPQADSQPADMEALGRQVREHLKAAGIAGAPVLACVNRDRVILKELHYPKVSAGEEPAIVRFQAAKELTESLEDMVLDYMPLGENALTHEQRALAFLLRRDQIYNYQRVCLAAGLKLEGLTVRPVGISACLGNESVEAGGAVPVQAALCLTDRWSELCVFRGETLLFARTLSSGPGLAGELRRNLAVYAGQWPQDPIATFLVAGESPHVPDDRLQEVVGRPVRRIDPLEGAVDANVPSASRGAFAGAVGLLWTKARHRRLAINFIKPREPKPPRDDNKRRLLVAAGIAGVVLVCLAAWGYTLIARKDQEIKFMEQERAELDRQLLSIEEDAKRIKALDEWAMTEIVWLDELYDWTDCFPDPNDLRLVQLETVDLPVTSKARGGAKYAAHVKFTGITTEENQPIDNLISRLVGEGHYKVGAKELRQNRVVDRFRYRQEFILPMDVEKRPPSEYLRQLPSPDPDFGRLRGGRFGQGGADSPPDGFGGDQP